MPGRLDGKVAVITGAAGGIGEATARRFIEEGARVVIADIQVEAGQAAAAGLGDAAVFIHTDVTVEDQIAAAVDLAVSTWGQLDCMFNNAGVIGAVGPIAETDAEPWHRTIDVLLSSAFYGTKHAARVMIPNRSGVILTTSSVAGVIAGLGPHAYTVAKTGVIALARSAATELSRHGIRVNAIAPGTIPSPMTAAALTGDHSNIAAAAEHSRATNPLGITADPLDIANAALYLASDEARMVTGHVLVVDAGRSIDGGSGRFATASTSMIEEAAQSS
jgi:NAD(P)-dependent dehydrogenase (short-subunit alcohol dehydrogenase family)